MTLGITEQLTPEERAFEAAWKACSAWDGKITKPVLEEAAKVAEHVAVPMGPFAEVAGFGASYQREGDRWIIYTIPGPKRIGEIDGYDKARLDWIVEALRAAHAQPSSFSSWVPPTGTKRAIVDELRKARGNFMINDFEIADRMVGAIRRLAAEEATDNAANAVPPIEEESHPMSNEHQRGVEAVAAKIRSPSTFPGETATKVAEELIAAYIEAGGFDSVHAPVETELPAVKVKALEWADGASGTYTEIAESPFGHYTVWEINGTACWSPWKQGHGSIVEGGLRGAKAAAQADYERRILSALVPSTPAESRCEEPFGYWVEHKLAEPAFLRKPAYIPEGPNYKVTPLYTSPPSDDLKEAEGVRE